MYRKILGIALLLLGLNVNAQVTSPLLNCLDDRRNFSFTAKFNGQTATLTFKGWKYDLPYKGAYVSKTGERTSEYGNHEIYVATTLPFDKWVIIQTWGAPPNHVIAGAFCN